MNHTATVTQTATNGKGLFQAIGDFLHKHWQVCAWLVLLTAVNLPLLRGQVNDNLFYTPDSAANGQWWRLITYPMVHLSWYHLLLDGSAFLMLYDSMEEKRLSLRLLIIAICSATSILLGTWLGDVQLNGLSGLSGVAHGLMAFTGLEMLRTARHRLWGGISLGLVVAKSIYELMSGHVVFEFLHMGMCGLPVAACHAGGVAGGILAFFMMLVWNKITIRYER